MGFYHLGLFDLETALSIFDDLIPEIAELKRNWMLSSLITTLRRESFSFPNDAKIRAREVREKARLAMGEEGDGRHLTDEIAAILADDFEAAATLIEQRSITLDGNGFRRTWIENEDVLMRIYYQAGNWQKIIDHPKTILDFVDHIELKRRQWTFHAVQARALLETGESEKARAEAERANSCLDTVMATIPTEDLKNTYRAHPMAEEVAQVLVATS
jgi:hypothetical protein